MQIIREHTDNLALITKKEIIFFIFLLLCSISSILLVFNSDFLVKGITILFFVSALVFVLFDFKLSFSILIFTLYLKIIYLNYSLAEVFFLFVILSFLITYKKINLKEENYLIVPFLIFVVTVIPSYINSIDLGKNLILSLHLVVFFLLLFGVPLMLNSYQEMKYYLSSYLLFALFNGLHVIYLAIVTGKRVFGFAGVMFIDYAGIAIVILFTVFLYKRQKRFISFILFLLLFIALIFTQTRNAWISTCVTLLLILVHFIFVSPKFGYSRIKILFISLSLVIILLLSILLLKQLSPNTFARFNSNKVEANELVANNLQGISSLATRFFIWETAWNAFKAHPYIGIGYYSFPIASQKYSTLDPEIYKYFVKSLSPHLTFFSVPTEAGILGLLGFLYFLFISIRQAWITYKKSITKQQQFYSILLFWIIIYILASMAMSDAWLCANGLVLWGIVLGFSVASRKIIFSSESYNVNKIYYP